MIVTNITEFDKKRVKIFLDGEFAFVLYKGELCDYGIEQGKELHVEYYTEITETILVKRGKLRCMNLLQKKDYTEWQIRQKLSEGAYPTDVIDKAVEYVKSYHYIDDSRYVKQYINCYSRTKCRKQIAFDLIKKGVGKEIIKEIFSEMSDNGELTDETELIKRILDKKNYVSNEADWQKKQKMFAYLCNKGFSVEQIRRTLDIT